MLPWLIAAALTVARVPTASAGQTMSPEEHAAHMSQADHDVLHGPDSPVNGSGTAWLPASTTMEGVHLPAGAWTVMLHGQAFGQLVVESGEEHRRGTQAGSINWFMAMAERDAGGGQLQLRGMASLEPWTIRGCGYPNLLATGEICKGDDIHDRQHQHDLVMELSARYERPLTGSVRWHLYGGPAGEPALGPVAFQHRLAASWNPIAPITHHWLDSSHITYGVVTAGLSGGRWNAEGSVFNGREPDQRRTDFDFGALDSFAGRLSLAPTPNMVFQVSGGRLRDAEQGAGSIPPTSVSRGTASLLYNRPLSGGAVLAASVMYGVNAEDAIPIEGVPAQTTHAVLSEVALASANHVLFGRGEVVGKPAHDLHIGESPADVFTVGKLEAGVVRHMWQGGGARVSVGGMVMASVVPDALAPRYGGHVAPGFSVFLSLTPASSSEHAGHTGH